MATTEVTADTFPVLVGGEWRSAESGNTIEARNPATGELSDTSRAADLPISPPLSRRRLRLIRRGVQHRR